MTQIWFVVEYNSGNNCFYRVSAVDYEGSADNQELNIARELYSNFEYAVILTEGFMKMVFKFELLILHTILNKKVGK